MLNVYFGAVSYTHLVPCHHVAGAQLDGARERVSVRKLLGHGKRVVVGQGPLDEAQMCIRDRTSTVAGS